MVSATFGVAKLTINLTAHSPERLLEVATELNQRPRRTLGGITPAAALQKLLSNPPEPSVATTA
jgi:IS30 family transposase